MNRTASELLGTLSETEAKAAPARLYLAGDEACLDAGLRVAVVGSRKPSQEAIRRTRVLVEELVKNGVVIVSGLAEGIDTVAHKTAIECGGRTIAVIGCGLDQVFPTKNADLQRRIVTEHLVISQFPEGTPPKAGNFPQRNRTMALIADATVIVEAGEKSGTRHQGWEAIRLGRPVFLMRSFAEASDVAWVREMIDYGAVIFDREMIPALIHETPTRSRGEIELAI